MSGKARPRLVGLFVIAALLLLLGAVVAISSGRLFTQWRTWVVFLPGAASGLKEGSPVTMRGVQIGQVKDVELFFTGQGHQVGIMVVIQIRRGSIKTLGGHAKVAALSDAEVVRQQVAEGLRAELKSTSPVGGQKTIELDFHPEREARFAHIETPWPEVPTAPTGMERLNEKVEETLKKISELPIDEVVAQLRDTLKSVQGLVDSGDLRGALDEPAHRPGDGQPDAEERGQDDGQRGRARRRRADDHDHRERHREVAAVNARRDQPHAGDGRPQRRADGRDQLEAAQTLDEMRETMKALRFLIETLQVHPEALVQGKVKLEEKK